MKKTETIFWTTLLIIFILLVHNGATLVFLIAYTLIPVLIWLFYRNKSLWPLVIYLLFFAVLGRYLSYFRQGYMSDVLLATKDFLGFLLAGKNPYSVLIYSQKGLTPFIYLPFELLWYLPARVFSVDLRFFEMLISCLVVVLLFLITKFQFLPGLAVVSLTPFLLDLAADGSNDNSATFLLLLSIFLFQRHPRQSAFILGLGLIFKHYIWFYFFFLAVYLWTKNRQYIFRSFKTAILIILPFILSDFSGFFKAQAYIENRPNHEIWGWNFWNAIKPYLVLPNNLLFLIKNLAVLGAVIFSLRILKIKKLKQVFQGTVLTLFVYLIFSKWTTYAYFSFLIPLLTLSVTDLEN